MFAPRAVTTLVATIVSIVAVSAGQPRLIVGIVVDGLQQETLKMLEQQFGQNGFNRFIREGVVIDNLDYGTNLDATAATAMLQTGACPVTNGISGRTVYDVVTRHSRSIFADDKAMGNYTNRSLSPMALKVSTLSDEARIAGAGVTYVHAIAPTAEEALVLGAHAANSAVWFNENTGNWATSTFYGDMPYPAVNANRLRPLSVRIDTMQWTPSVNTAPGTGLPDHLTRYPFRYTFSRSDASCYARLANSPLINDEITNLAIEYIKSFELGKHDGSDVLNLAYTLKPYKATKTAESRYEQYDSYVKLDNSLSRLFDAINRSVGNNVLIYIAGTPPRAQRRRDDSKWNIPGGEFSTRKAISLLNLYLIAQHGNGEWVTAFNDGHFYLNHQLANTLNKDMDLIRRQTTEFLVRMAGVGHAYTIDDIVRADVSVPNAEGMSRNTVIAHSGDVVVDLLPGWTLVDDFNQPGQVPDNSRALATTTAPFMVLGADLTSRRIETPVDARAVVPALAGMMHIRSPNGVEVAPVTLK